MQIIVYDHKVKELSGVKTSELQICKWLNKTHKVTFVYKFGDASEFKEVCKVEQDNGQPFECDVVIQSSVFVGEANIKAKKKIQLIHTDLKHYDVKILPKADVYVAVSELAGKKLKEHFGVEAVIIPNILKELKVDPVLRLITLSRLERGKGIDKVVEMATRIKQDGVRFEWSIYGTGALEVWLRERLWSLPEVSMKGYNPDATLFIKGNDYLVQLSESEGFCYSVYEALQRGVPVLITDWEGSDKIINTNGVNGYKFRMDLKDFDTKMILNKPFFDFKMEMPESILQKWEKVLL
jgi:glycosyltransferase involved in cell wall biosynthesis